MNIRIPFAPAVLLAGAAIVLMSGCAAESEPASSGDQGIAVGEPMGGDASGIQQAQPSGAPDPAVAAKRRAPEAIGAVASTTFGEDSVQVVFTPDAGYEYFAGTTFDIPFSAATAIDGETAVVLGDLKPGDRINVWTANCRESQPVQCDVEAVTAAQ